jgi:hypothetical protein
MIPAEEDEPDDHAYFQAIEEIFVSLRGAPLLLSPNDWQIARRWHRDGVPLDVVRAALHDVFARRKQRGAKGKISSLRYCAPAVEAAWQERRELTGPGRPLGAPAFDAAARLRALAGALPDAVPGRDALAGRIRALTGDPEAIEDELSHLDDAMLAAVAASLPPAAASEIEAVVEKTLQGLKDRLPADELERSCERLTIQVLRQRLRLPMLSLFSPDAER